MSGLEDSGPAVFTLYLSPSAHGFTNSLFSGNSQICFSSLHFLPSLQTHMLLEKNLKLNTQNLPFFKPNLETQKSSSYQGLRSLLVVGAFSQASWGVQSIFSSILFSNIFCLASETLLLSVQDKLSQ